jgi:hypothetical protein
VANLYLWSASVSRDVHPLSRRFRRHRLLILQAAFLGAVTFAAATPMRRADSRPVAFILDISVSMQARDPGVRHPSDPSRPATRLDGAVERAVALASTLPRATQVRLVAAGAAPQVVGEFPARARELTRALHALRASDARADITAAIDVQRSSESSPRQMYVFSDGAPPAGPLPTDLTWTQIGTTLDNAAISDISVRHSTRASRTETEVLVTVANHGKKPLATAVSLVPPGSSQPISVAPGSSTVIAFTVADVSDVVTASLNLDDALSADNQRALVVAPPSRIRTLFLGRSVFLEQALLAHPDVLLSRGSDPDVVVCAGCEQTPEIGRGTLLVPEQKHEALAPLPLVARAPEHPLLFGVDFDGIGASPPAGLPAPVAGVLAQAGAQPALVASESGARRALELRVDPSGQFARSPAFPILVANAVSWLAGRDRNPSAVVAGDAVQWHIGPQKRTPAVTTADGREVPSAFANGVLTIDRLRVRGTYRVTLDEGVRPLVVNPDVQRESDLSSVSTRANSTNAGVQRGEPRDADMTMMVLAGALLLLALEWRYRFKGVGHA